MFIDPITCFFGMTSFMKTVEVVTYCSSLMSALYILFILCAVTSKHIVSDLRAVHTYMYFSLYHMDENTRVLQLRVHHDH